MTFGIHEDHFELRKPIEYGVHVVASKRTKNPHLYVRRSRLAQVMELCNFLELFFSAKSN